MFFLAVHINKNQNRINYKHSILILLLIYQKAVKKSIFIIIRKIFNLYLTIYKRINLK